MIHRKRSFLFLCLFLYAGIMQAQNVAINTDGTKANPNAMLDIQSGNKGLLIPRMSSEARLKIPATQGLLVYDTNTNSFWYNTGRSWVSIPSTSIAAASATDPWLLGGNAGTVDGTNFLGTTDNVALSFRVNNQRSGRIDVENTFFGYRSAFQNPTGQRNTAIGSSALFSTTTGFDNTAVGSVALASNTTGWSNSAFGRLALEHNTTGNYNTAIGQSALIFNSTGSENVAVGMGAALGNGSSNYNTAIGTNSQMFHQQHENTSVGGYSLAFYDGGNGNTAVGFRAHAQVTPSNNYNTAIGHSTSIYSDVSYATALGYSARVEGNNATAIGNGAVSNASNKVRIGNAAVTVIEGQVPFTTPSDGRFKFGVQEDVGGLDFIMQLRPVTYQFDVKKFDAELGITASKSNYDEAFRIRRTGFIAQEVEQAALKSGYNFSGIIKPTNPKDHYSLSYDAFVVPLVKGMQEQQQVIGDQQKTIQEQNKKIDDLQRQLDELKNAVKKLQAAN